MVYTNHLKYHTFWIVKLDGESSMWVCSLNDCTFLSIIVRISYVDISVYLT